MLPLLSALSDGGDKETVSVPAREETATLGCTSSRVYWPSYRFNLYIGDSKGNGELP